MPIDIIIAMAEQTDNKAEAAAQRRADHKKKQKRLLIVTATVLVLGVVGFFAYNYISGAEERAQEQVAEGVLLMAPGSYGEAIPFFDAAISTNPQNVDAYFQRALANEKLGNYEVALEDYQRVVAMDNNRVEAHTAMANIYRENGENDRALEAFTASLNLSPTADAYNQRGMTYAALGRHQEAVDDFTEAIVLRRDAPYVYLARANSRRALGDVEGAREDEAMAESYIRVIQ